MRTPLSLLALAAGAVLLGAAAVGTGSADGATGPRGGTLKVNLASDFDAIDPALARTASSWQLLQATCARLMTYPDWVDTPSVGLVPEAAQTFPLVSRDGRTYSFTLRNDYRFSTGQKLTARGFARAIERALDPKMVSPLVQYVTDIVGAGAVLGGSATTPSGVTASGQRLTIRLRAAAPDFLARLATPFLCAVPPGLPSTPGGAQAPLPSAGPYYVAEWSRARSALVLRNPYYRGPRKAYVDAMQFTMGVPSASSLLQVQKGEADLGPIPPSAHGDLYKTYGNGKRYFVRPSLTLLYVALNNERPLFRDTKTRKAVNYAIDRPELVRQYGYLAGRRTDQFLPDGMPGFTSATIYPIAGARPDLARKLVGDLGGRKAVLLTGTRGSSPLAAQVVQYNLKQIGLDVDIQLVDDALLPQQLGTRGGAWDLAIAGWSADYADPYAFLNVLFDGRRITEVNNTNLNYFNEPTVNRRLTKASRLAGPERYQEYAQLDADLMRTYAPGAPYVVLNRRAFVSARVGCVKFVPLEGLSLASVCLS